MKTISIEVIVDVKYWPKLKLWDVFDSIDTRTGRSLGRLTTYGFEHSAGYLDRIMLESSKQLSNEKRWSRKRHILSCLKCFESGKLIGSSVSTFSGTILPLYHPTGAENWLARPMAMNGTWKPLYFCWKIATVI